MKKILKKNWRILFLMYIFIYLPWFFFCENTITSDLPNFHIIHSFIDDLIPFNEYFVIPYIVWFFYIAVVCIFVYFKGTDSEYLKLALTLMLGMSLSLIIYMIYPNGQTIRPVSFERDNIFTNLVSFIYLSDTPNNVFPSIHVYNSLAIHISVSKLKVLENHKRIKMFSLVLCILISISTILIKQHSIYDVLGASLLMAVLYWAVYVVDFRKIFKKEKDKEEILE